MQLTVPEFQQRRRYTRLSAVELCCPRITLQLQCIDSITVTWYPVTHENQRPLSHWWDHCQLVPCHIREPETVITLMGSLSVGTLSHIKPKTTHYQWLAMTASLSAGTELHTGTLSRMRTKHCHYWSALTVSVSPGTMSHTRTIQQYHDVDHEWWVTGGSNNGVML